MGILFQLGDQVVYFRQGHDAYLNAVEQLDLFNVAPRMRPKEEMDAEVFRFLTFQ